MADLTQVPPSTNRGVQNTSRRTLRACVDWFQGTLPAVLAVQQAADFLGIDVDQFKDMPSGRYGYKSHKRMGHISLLYDGSPGMGVHIEMSGQGCREYEALGAKTWKQLIMNLFADGGHLTRLDGAIDELCYYDHPPYYTMDTIYRKIKDGCCSSKFKKGKRVESYMLADGSGLGETLYFGREQSDLQIRMYEKDHERQQAGKDLEEGLTKWNRTELQCRRDRAQALGLYIVNNDDLGATLAGILRNYLNFLVKNSSESNKDRWKVSKWWLDYLGDVEPLKLTMVAPDATIERSRSWIEKQVLPALGMLFYAGGSDMQQIVDMLNDGMDRMTDQQIMLADEYRAMMSEVAADVEYEKVSFLNSYLHRTIREASLEQKKIVHLDDQADDQEQ